MTRAAFILGAAVLAGMLFPTGVSAQTPPANPPILWYAQPAVRWMESLPVGSGRIGAMVFGGTGTARIALNESTVWSGEPGDAHENPRMREHLDEIRTALFEGRYFEAQGMCQKYVLGRELNYGSHLPMGDLLLRFAAPDAAPADYRRELDLDQAIARVSYTVGKTHCKTEVFCSNVDQVLVVRLSSDTPGGLSFEVGMNGGALPFEVHADGSDTLVMTGNAFEKKHSNGKTGVAFRGQVKAVATGGEVTAGDGALKVKNADAVVLLVAINTNYRNGNAEALCKAQLDAAARKTYAQLREPGTKLMTVVFEWHSPAKRNNAGKARR